MEEVNEFAYLEIPEEECQTYGKIKLRPYQQVAVNKAIESFKEDNAPSVISASVGAGKTVIIAAIHKHVESKKGRVLTLSRQGEIIKQDSDDVWLAECRNSIFSASLGKKTVTYPHILGTEGTVYNALESDLMYWVKHCNGSTPFGGLSPEIIERYKDKINESGKEFFEPSPFKDIAFDLLQIDECHMVDFEESTSQYMVIISELLRRNPKMRILGLTGTPYRGVTPIIGEQDEYFWKKKLTDIPQQYLTNLDYLVPCTFGFGDENSDTKYKLDGFDTKRELGTQDYTAAELREMESLMLQAKTTTEKIMIEVMAKTKNRNCVMITGAGKKHLKEAAKFLPKGSYAIITDDVSPKTRQKQLKAAFDGKIKYLLQVGCLTTGLNIPLIDTIVILRNIGSLTLLVQLIGRGLRKLKDFQEDMGIIKNDCLVLDYSDTMAKMRELYDDPILDEADLSKSREDMGTIKCPKCGEENGFHAVRCRGVHNGQRCDFFFKSRTCDPFYINGELVNSGCGAENAPTARTCRICGNTLIDPNNNLSRKHYTETDFKPVEKFTLTPTKNNGVLAKYFLPEGEIATKFYTPFSENAIAKRIWYNEFIKNHCATPSEKAFARKMRNAGEICENAKSFDTIKAITHRINSKSVSVISKYILKD